MHHCRYIGSQLCFKMAATSESNPARSRGNVMTGELPDDFLRISGGPNQATTVPVRPVYYTQPAFFPYQPQPLGRLSITVQQAKLAKNYGLTRMDPYCRITVGNHVLETPTAHNGSTNPRWNKLISVPVQDGVNSIYVEIFDERAFSMDQRIAWGLIPINDTVLAGETLEDWYSLSGKQGDEKEGMINLVVAYRKVVPAPAPQPQAMVYPSMPVMMVPQPAVPGAQVVYPGGYGPGQPVPTGQPQQPRISEQDVSNLKDMFPSMEEGVIRSVLEVSRGDVGAATTHLLSMTADS